LDIEWLLSTLFDASLLSPWAAGNGGSFLFSRPNCGISRRYPGRQHVGNFPLNLLDSIA